MVFYPTQFLFEMSIISRGNFDRTIIDMIATED